MWSETQRCADAASAKFDRYGALSSFNSPWAQAIPRFFSANSSDKGFLLHACAQYHRTRTRCIGFSHTSFHPRTRLDIIVSSKFKLVISYSTETSDIRFYQYVTMDVNLERFNSRETYAHVKRNCTVEFTVSTAADEFH